MCVSAIQSMKQDSVLCSPELLLEGGEGVIVKITIINKVLRFCTGFLSSLYAFQSIYLYIYLTA